MQENQERIVDEKVIYEKVKIVFSGNELLNLIGRHLKIEAKKKNIFSYLSQ